MTDQIDAAGNLPVTPAIEPVTPGPLPDAILKAQADAVEWQRRFAGLQGKYQQEQEKWAQTAAKLLEVDESSKKVVGEFEALKVEHSKTAEEKDTYFTELELKKAELERVSIVTKEFPQLVPLLQDDVLPDGTGDELRGKLKILAERIESIKKGEFATNLAGASPESPPQGIPKGIDAIRLQMMTAMREGRMDDYNKFYAQYVEQSSPKGG
jgi:hypothetical protein